MAMGALVHVSASVAISPHVVFMLVLLLMPASLTAAGAVKSPVVLRSCPASQQHSLLGIDLALQDTSRLQQQSDALVKQLGLLMKQHDPYSDLKLLCRTASMIKSGKVADLTVEDAQKNLKKALEKGTLKILSKMGISLLSCYHGAQIFECYGLGPEIVDAAFRGSVSRIGGMDLADLQRESESFWAKVLAWVYCFSAELGSCTFMPACCNARYGSYGVQVILAAWLPVLCQSVTLHAGPLPEPFST